MELREREADEKEVLREEGRVGEMRMSQSSAAEGLERRREPKSTRMFLSFRAV